MREAYKFADQAHLGQLRASGIPYITHPLAVTGLVADWKLDAQSIMAALMHDTIEDFGVTKPEAIGDALAEILRDLAANGASAQLPVGRWAGPHTSSRSRSGSSMHSLMRTRNCTASRPSMRRWS